MHTNAEFSSSSPWDLDSGKLELSLEICPFNSAPQFWSRQFQEQSLRNNKRIVSFIKTKHKTAEDDTASKSSEGREDTKRPCLCPKCYLLEDSHCPHHPWSTLEGSGALFPMPYLRQSGTSEKGLYYILRGKKEYIKILLAYKYKNLLYLTAYQRKPFLIYSLCSSTKNPVTFDTLRCTWGCWAARRLTVKSY